MEATYAPSCTRDKQSRTDRNSSSTDATAHEARMAPHSRSPCTKVSGLSSDLGSPHVAVGSSTVQSSPAERPAGTFLRKTPPSAPSTAMSSPSPTGRCTVTGSSGGGSALSGVFLRMRSTSDVASLSAGSVKQKMARYCITSSYLRAKVMGASVRRRANKRVARKECGAICKAGR
eukprot:scaffold194556_cov28-Tisochrysis_lutea.AAC.2